ncbi:lipoprotein [Spiroplasma endosymbiont of Glossina fuscipes fuscipes]|uniref:lipoprotein n=1 Tax=Spiroplasma endosymbiont of Glossina fuscipes fuscipes TaxID=2004463 RepID=UPI003CE7B27C
MKRLLSIIGAISLVGTSTTSLVACNKPQQEYTKEELAKLKEENKINTTNQQIKNNLEWIAPQEKPFNQVDNKWYYVVWRGNENDNWIISKFKNNIQLEESKKYNIDKLNDNTLDIYYIKGETNQLLTVYDKKRNLIMPWNNKYENGAYPKLKNWIKSVYRWNLDTQEPDLIIDNDGNVKVNGE